MPSYRKFSGLLTALPTPTKADGSVATDVLARLVRIQVEAGADGLVPMGGTGEYTALAPKARVQAVETAIAAAGDVPVVPGVLSPGFGEAVETGLEFMRRGAAGLMVIAPFYATPTQQGIREYFKAYRDKIDLPIILYDIPRFTNTYVEADTIAQMVEDGTVNGIKACNTDFNHFMRLAHLVGDRMSLLSGEDRLCPLHMTLGATGGVLASATLVPQHWKKIIALVTEGRLHDALAEQKRLWPLFDAIYRETNPAPLKQALALLGYDAGEPRLPLRPATPETRSRMEEALSYLRNEKLLHL